MIRVSDVLKLIYPDGLNFIEQEHLDRGSRLHFMMEIHCNNMINGYRGDLSSGGGFDEYKEFNRIEAMTAWMEHQRFVPLHVEAEYADVNHGFEGHPDCVGYLDGVKRRDLTLDWKFCEQLNTGNLIQAEAYRHLTANPVWLVQCTRAAKITLHKCKPRPDLWAVFLSGLNVLKFQYKIQPQYIDVEQLAKELSHGN